NSNSNFANPLSLYILYAWGAGQASNVLRAFADRLDPTLYFGLGELVRTEGKRQRQTDPNSSFQYPERRWTLISDYFVPVKKGSQSILYSDSWMTQRLNSASGAFVDSFIAIDKSYKTALAPAKQLSGSIAPGGKTTTATVDNKGEAVAAAAVAGLRAAGANAPAGAGSDASAPVKAPEPPPVRGNKVPIFHYLEPVPDYYRHLSTFVLNYENELIRLNAFPEDQRSKLSDFRRLLDRMVKICDKEINLEPLPSADFHLLANFDQVLSAVDSPLAGSIYVPGVNGGGASLGLGNAGACYVIFNTDKGPYLSRGAVYSYFEVAGGPFKMEHWERKRAFGFLRPLSWLSQFDLMQENSDSVKEDKDKKDTKDFKDSKNSKDKSDARTNKGSASPNSNFNTPGPLPTLKVK
ncbi:MAG: DUF3160 domain-containing protein, partial [Cyanobacteria bacterium REEB67]|nr:DUF3160 domain-containing protein [Cyanobacteria bacterium REEB67]